MMQCSNIALLLVSLFRCAISSQSNVEYIITPVYVPSKQPCHNCLTLTQFAVNSSHYLSDNTTLILQPGSHRLNSRLLVSDVETFTIYHISEPDNTLSCNQNSSFIFDTVQSVYISNLNLIECFGSKVTNTKLLHVLNSNFTGSFSVTSGTALEVTDTTATLTHCFFTKYYYGTYRTTISSKPHSAFVQRSKKWIGGAMIITHSNVAVVQSHFEENRAQIGGAIHAENNSNITINETSFIFNTANTPLYSPDLDRTAAGGALYAIHNCSVFVYNSYFDRNQVYSGYRLGGAIAMHKGSLFIIGSILTNNQAEIGGVAYLSESLALFRHSELSSSKALNSGGVLAAVNSTINFVHCHNITNNHASRGGVVYMRDSTIMMNYSNFIGNSIIGDAVGGVIYAEVESNISVKSCVFKSNSAFRGAVMCLKKIKCVKVESCVFVDNRAKTEGGAFYFTAPTIYDKQINEKSAKMFIKQSRFLSNTAGTEGGVLYSHHNDLIIEDSDNVYKKNSANGGGVILHMVH